MSPALRASIDVARSLAWLPIANLGGASAHRYRERYELADELRRRIADVRSLSANASPELVCLVAAIRRAATASYANRRGAPYYERRQAILELRGCLDVYDRPHPATDHVDAIGLPA